MKRPLPTPTQSSDLVNKDGQPGTHFYRWMDGVNQSVIDTQDTLTSLQTSAATIPSGSAPYYFCRAWVNFDGTRDTTNAVSTANTNRLLKGFGNVSSVLRNAVGVYTITFTTPMSDANYAVIGMGQYDTTTSTSNNTGVSIARVTNAQQAGSIRINTQATNGGALIDFISVSVAIFR